MTKLLAAIVFVGIAYFGFTAFRFLSAGPGETSDEVVFDVTGGKPFRVIAQQLEKQNLILSAFKMRVLARITGEDRLIKRGEYRLNRGMTPQEIMSVLISGKSIQYPITFPEGSNIFEMAALLESKHFFTAKEFLEACRNPQLIKELLGVEVSSLEGYLFPETYQLTKLTTLHELLVSMVQNFKGTYTILEQQNPGRPTHLSRHELVTLASMVEKETGAANERPMIASVFYNRLQKNMKLQSDPTIIYGYWVETGTYKDNITKDDLLRPNHYNTYTVPRLPFGPIANPGREALTAVMKPATSEFLYFVSHNDGTHQFSKTYEEHVRGVKTFQLDPAAREGKSWRDLKKTTAPKAIHH